MFYEIKLKVEKENSKGEMKEVVEHFITDVELFAEAECRRDSQRKGRRQALLQSHVDRHIHRRQRQ